MTITEWQHVNEAHRSPPPQLFSDVCPKTSKNFEALCTGERGLSQSGLPLFYKGSVFHRVVPNGWVQGGGMVHTSPVTMLITLCWFSHTN